MPEKLYDDINAMLEVSELIYFVAGLSKEKEKIQHAEFFDELPKTSIEIAKWAEENKDVIDIDELHMNLLKQLLERDDKDQADETTLEVFDDDFAWAGGSSEVVYGITTNPDKKRIAVVFRGSQNLSDWLQNFKFRGKEVELNEETFKDIPNPNLELLKDTKEVEVHRGFVQYLFERYTKTEGGEKTEEPKALQIVKHVTRLLEKNPDYELWFSGHSLGGSLAMIGAAYAAASNDIKKPIKLVTFGSPNVGKSGFVEAMGKLEAAKVLLHVRVTTNDDLVPQLLGMFGYEHFGLHFNLFDSKHILSYDQDGMKMPWFWQILDRHGMGLYFERFQKTKEDIRKYEFDTVFGVIKEEKERSVESSSPVLRG